MAHIKIILKSASSMHIIKLSISDSYMKFTRCKIEHNCVYPQWQSWLFKRFYLLGLTKPRETHILICARFSPKSIELLLFPIFNANISLKKGYFK